MIMNVIVFLIIVIVAIFILTSGIIGKIIPGTENAEYQKKMNTIGDLSNECTFWAKGLLLRSFYSDKILYYSQEHDYAKADNPQGFKEGWSFCKGYLTASGTSDEKQECRAACVNFLNVLNKCDGNPNEYEVFTGIYFTNVPTFGVDARQVGISPVTTSFPVFGVQAPQALDGTAVSSEVAKTYCKYYMIPVIYNRLSQTPPEYSLDKENLVREMCPSNVALSSNEVAGISLTNADGRCQCSYDTTAQQPEICGIGQCCLSKSGIVTGMVSRKCVDAGDPGCHLACNDVNNNVKLASDCVCGGGTSGYSEVCSAGEYCCRATGSRAIPASQADYTCSPSSSCESSGGGGGGAD